MVRTTAAVKIKNLLEEHWSDVKAIYESGVATGDATFQTEAPANWELWDNGHLRHSRFVAIENNEVIGWIALSPTSARDCYKGVCELSIYIHQHHRGKGIGNLLMGAVIKSSEANKIWCLYSSTFPENTASIALHKIAQLNGVWRNTLLLERRSTTVGV